MGDIINAGINLSLVNINQSGYGFEPDAKNNRILYGMKAMLNVGDDVIDATIKNRPYISIKDYYNKVHPNKQAMISLIKGGAFDDMMERKMAMAWFIWETCDKKKRITLQNMGGLIKYGLLPEKNKEEVMARRIYEFNRYLKAICKNGEGYILDNRALNFIHEIEADNLLENKNNEWYISAKNWDKKVYQKWMDVFRAWIAENKDEILNTLNSKIFYDDWSKYAKGTISAWEMEALCFYYHEHELAHVDSSRYGFVNFMDLPETPVIDKVYKKNGKEIKIFKLNLICGTCIAKNKVKSTVSLLTTTGVVTVKFRKEYFNLFDKQISEKNPDGTKTVKEKSWFNRGSMIIVQGIRSDDNFVTKKYKNVGNDHQLYKIDSVNNDGTINIRSERYQGESEEDNE